jgi:hypothetical protein
LCNDVDFLKAVSDGSVESASSKAAHIMTVRYSPSPNCEQRGVVHVPRHVVVFGMKFD